MTSGTSPCSPPSPTLPGKVRNNEDWRASEGAILALVEARHGDPFAVLGPHPLEGEAAYVLRVFLPGAERAELVSGTGGTKGGAIALERRHEAGFFEALIPGAPPAPGYRLHAANAEAEWEVVDPFGFAGVLGALDDYLLLEGTHRRLYERLGAHPMTHQGVGGVHFAVWAPNASAVSLVGEFNFWDARPHPMRKRVDSGLWEIFLPGLGEGAKYKFRVRGADGVDLPLKADPFGFFAELRPATASVVARTDNFTWSDRAWMARRAAGDPRRVPISAYEVHLGSWKRGWAHEMLDWDQLAEDLVPYAAGLGFTHLELLPVTEHPLDDSWGYQPVGMFAITSRFGTPDGFARFVDRAHQAGLGVILDWVPAHFPVDAHGLARFDGQPLYECADPRRGMHMDWGTAIFDYGRREVANYLIASALYWLDRFHIDALRVDAVASMLYLDYSRQPGEWLPNPDGSNDNRDAVQFLQHMNEAVYAAHPGAFTVAEESTAWAGVTAPSYVGGLGFGLKWNMGWMHDTLDYLSKDPVYRPWHHDRMTFGLLYAFAENFVLPLSHDEVVHGKRSLLERMPGDEWQRFANLRALYAVMWGYPGKKLLFMGQEIGQGREWNANDQVEWYLLDFPLHQGVQKLVGDLNRLYRDLPALHARDCEGEGFAWLVVDDSAQSVFAWARFAGDAPPVVCVVNFTPVVRRGYRVGLPRAGAWRELVNTDAALYGGSDVGNAGMVVAEGIAAHGQSASAELVLPPLGAVWLTPA
jgi:1,4-alpha-glucan branching enzyme